MSYIGQPDNLRAIFNPALVDPGAYGQSYQYPGGLNLSHYAAARQDREHPAVTGVRATWGTLHPRLQKAILIVGAIVIVWLLLKYVVKHPAAQSAHRALAPNMGATAATQLVAGA